MDQIGPRGHVCSTFSHQRVFLRHACHPALPPSLPASLCHSLSLSPSLTPSPFCLSFSLPLFRSPFSSPSPTFTLLHCIPTWWITSHSNKTCGLSYTLSHTHKHTRTHTNTNTHEHTARARAHTHTHFTHTHWQTPGRPTRIHRGCGRALERARSRKEARKPSHRIRFSSTNRAK